MKHLILMLIAIGICSCGDPPKEEKVDKGRPETQKLKAVDAAGYDGDALKGTVDKMLDKRDQQKQDLDNAQKTPIDGEDKNE
jgi:hypothetical protein